MSLKCWCGPQSSVNRGSVAVAAQAGIRTDSGLEIGEQFVVIIPDHLHVGIQRPELLQLSQIFFPLCPKKTKLLLRFESCHSNTQNTFIGSKKTRTKISKLFTYDFSVE